MAVYRFRVSFEDYDDVYRDIEIRSLQSFEQFQEAIQTAIGFDNTKPASFYMSNDLWKKGQEINNHNSPKSSPDAKPMKDCRLSDYIADPHQKIYYIYDMPLTWTFFIELYKIFPDGEAGKKYPVCVKVHGEAPKQYAAIEPPKGMPDTDFLDEEIFTEVLVDENEESGEEADSAVSAEVGFGEAVDEEEYDNIEESAEEEGDKEL